MFLCRWEKAWYWVWVSPEDVRKCRKRLNIAIEKCDMMSVQVAREMIAWAKEKLKSAAKHVICSNVFL